MAEFIGRGGHIAGYDLLVHGERVTVTKDGALVTSQMVPSYGTRLSELSTRPGFALGWTSFTDEAEVLYLYDTEDDNFGYALNLSDPACSEWGYAPFARQR